VGIIPWHDVERRRTYILGIELTRPIDGLFDRRRDWPCASAL